MKLISTCLLVSQLLFLVACSSLPSGRHNNPVSSTAKIFTNPISKTATRRSSSWFKQPTAPQVPPHERQVLYNKYKNECLALRTEFSVANSKNRELGREWRTVRGEDRLSGRGRAMFRRNYKASHKYSNIQRKSINKMKANKKAILSQLPSFNADICDTQNMRHISFPPMTGTVL